jgi:hypothetical protein
LSDENHEEMGPIDYLVVEWPGQQPTGEAIPHLVDLVDGGLIRIIDLAFIRKAEDGTVSGVEIDELGEGVAELKVFEGVSSGIISGDDLEEAAQALEPGTAAALLIYENRWAAPFAAALRRNGAMMVAGGRIPVQDLIEALDATEA